MRFVFYVLSAFCLLGFNFKNSVTASEKKLKLTYQVDLTKIETDSFFVELEIKGFSSDTAVFQFASTAPGTYQVMDVGRFAGSFRAFSSTGVLLPVYRISTNQYLIRNAQTLSRITYQIEDTYDTQITEHPVYPMSGSNLENDNALLNGQMLFGFVRGYQSNPIQVKFNYPKEWKVATALEESKGSYVAQTYDELVDSPFMFGKLTHATSKIGGTKVHIYCYSQNGMITADSLLAHMNDMLRAADKFIGKLPVKHYTFLFHFRKDLPPAYGAWEHSYSSFYAMPETTFRESAEQILSFASHEFFHIITPLNIHSEIIEQFNFETPVPSQHLWLYEGTTEWAAQMMQIRGRLISPEEFTRRITQKLNTNDHYRQDVSLVDLSLGSYGELESQYINIYMKGALTAMMLDMRLLELSKGKTGLRDVIQKLSKKYGTRKAFSEKDFFDEFVKMTYPEIGDFFNRYVKGTEGLPVKNMMGLAGFEYLAEYKTGKFTSSQGSFKIDFVNNALIVKDVNPTDSVNISLGIQNGDVLLKIKYKDETFSLFDPQVQRVIKSIQPKDIFTWIIMRDGKELELTAPAGQKEVSVKHRIVAVPEPTKEQMDFRNRWLTN